MRNIIEKIEKAQSLSKKLAKEITMLSQSVSQYGNEVDETVKAWLETQETRIEQLEKRNEKVKQLTQGFIKLGYEQGFSVSRYVLRAKDALGDNFDKGNEVKTKNVSLDKENEFGVSLGDKLSDDDKTEKGRKVKLSFDELKNLIKTGTSPLIWAKCFNVADYLHFMGIKKEVRDINNTRQYAIRMIIAETHGNAKELQILEAKFEAVKYSAKLKKAKSRKEAA